MEKEPDSMATVQMKAEYAASEVYSTAGSEAPPELPNAEALLQSKPDVHDNDISKDQKDETEKKEEKVSEPSQPSESESENDSSFSDSDESNELNRVHIKLPLELDLSELANAILETNQKSRMNCVVERRRAEEFIDAPSKTMQLPFGVNLTTDPKRKRVTGERMAIFCESGVEPKQETQAEQIPQFMMPPPQRHPISFGPIPQQVPLTHMPYQMPPHMQQQQQLPQFAPPQFMIRQVPQPQQQQQPQHPPQPMMHQMPPNLPVPDQVMQAPRPEQPEVRIQLQRIPFPIRGDVSEPVQIREILTGRQMPNMSPQVQVQRIPLSVALQRAGITPDDLRNIQRMAEERIQQEFRHLAAEDSSNQSSGDSSDASEDEEEENDSQTESEQQPQILQIGRVPFARSLLQPVRIPVNMMQTETSEEPAPSNRPHFVQPRSVRSVDSVLTGQKRVKRCACDCSC
ncbi:hypothetical protein Bhyg_08642 [Pseudolycoriella hygida]|uniref:Uncharacterized protein n=1 Tax=Pseudolycoriella hygida TaxID=35572 RepID=A0A9Q0S4I8_9DIPT|nr:hypothetical protein Bhyg_08642 [Pseudolycoriella hygida]